MKSRLHRIEITNFKAFREFKPDKKEVEDALALVKQLETILKA